MDPEQRVAVVFEGFTEKDLVLLICAVLGVLEPERRSVVDRFFRGFVAKFIDNRLVVRGDVLGFIRLFCLGLFGPLSCSLGFGHLSDNVLEIDRERHEIAVFPEDFLDFGS